MKPRFSDVPIENGYWDEIEYLAKCSIVHGKGDGRFAPRETLTKTHVARMVARALKLEDKYPATYSFTHQFADVPKNHSAYLDIMRVTEAGIFDETASFNGSNGFTRGEMAVVLTRAFDIKGSTIEPKTFSDVQPSTVGQEMYDAIRTSS